MTEHGQPRTNVEIDDNMWAFLQQHLRFTDPEMVQFKNRPVNAEIVSKALSLANLTVTAQVVESHGCASGHQAGDRFYFDGFGNLITQKCPEKVCSFALHAFSLCLYTGLELFLAGVDPNQMKFNRVGCQDVGVWCDGWGHVVMEYRVETAL